MDTRTAKDAKRGDRVWISRTPSGRLQEIIIDDPIPWWDAANEFNEEWGFLADDETVIGGVLVRPSVSAAMSWVIGEYRFKIASIEMLTPQNKYCQKYGLLSTDIATIQDHVRKHSAPAIVPKAPPAPAPKKRAAEDAKPGDEVWVIHAGKRVSANINRVSNNRVEILGWPYGFGAFGGDWGFLEDHPDVQALPIIQPAPVEEKPAPSQADGDRAMLARKSAQWIRVHRPDVWKRLRAATIEAVRREHEKLNQPGVFSGKTPRFK